MEFWRYYRVLRRRRWLVIAAVVAAVAVMIAVDRPREDDFSATALLSMPHVQRFFYVAGISAAAGAEGGLDSRTAVAFGLIRSREVAQRVIGSLNLQMRPEDLLRRISVRRDPNSDLIRVTVTGMTAREAVTLANAVADAAASYDQELERSDATLAREFLERQAEEMQANLRAADRDLLSFRQNNGSTLAASRDSQVAFLETEMQRTAVSLQETEARLGSLLVEMNQRGAPGADHMIADSPIVALLRQQLAKLEVAVTAELALHTDKYPTVTALKAQIQALKDRLQTELSQIASAEQVDHTPMYDALLRDRITLETEKVALQARQEALQSALARVNQALPKVAQTQTQQSTLGRSVEILATEYAKLQEQLAEARLREQEAQNLGSLSVAAHARTVEPSPLHGLRFRVTFASLLGLFAGVGLAFFLEYADNTLKSPETAERLLGVPVLAAVPYHNPPFDEAYRLLRVNLDARDGEEGAAALLLVTSPKPGGGASTVVANLARAFAQAGRHTIVVDAALQRPVQHVHFGVANERGLTEVLLGHAGLSDALVETGVPNLRIVPAGTCPKEIGGLLSSKAMAGVLAEVKRKGDVVLIDTPPAGGFADVFALASLASGVLLVLNARWAPRGVEEKVRAQLERLGAKVVGAVLTKVRPNLVDSYVYQERFYANGPRKRSPAVAGATVAAALVVILGMLAAVTGWVSSLALPGISGR